MLWVDRGAKFDGGGRCAIKCGQWMMPPGSDGLVRKGKGRNRFTLR